MRILIATGGSGHSEAALCLAIHILRAQHLDAGATVLTVVRREADQPAAEAILAQACDLFGSQALKAQTKIRTGQRAEEIIHEAKEGQYDLVILGKRPAHRLITRFLGSTATRVTERVPCPVLIVKGQPRPVQRILFCDSGVRTPSLLSHFTGELAGLFSPEVEVTVLHVMSQISAGPGVRDDQLRANADELIRVHAPEGELLVQDIEALQQAHVPAIPKIRHGLVVDEIVDEARRGDYDLVAIGAHRREGWWSFLLANLARQIIAQIDRSVLVVR